MKMFYASSRHMPDGQALAVMVVTAQEVRENWTGLDQITVPDKAMKSLARELFRYVEEDIEPD